MSREIQSETQTGAPGETRSETRTGTPEETRTGTRSETATGGPAGAREIRGLSAAALDALYRAGEAGPIPVGRTRGTVLVLTGSPLHAPVAGLVRALKWKGKIFDPERGELKNRMGPLGTPAIRARVYEGESWFDEGGRAVILDYSETSRVAGKIRDEIRRVAPGVYLGHAYWGERRVLRFMLELEPGGA